MTYEQETDTIQSDFVPSGRRAPTQRPIKNEWRVACGEAIRAGAVIIELRTRTVYTPWDGRTA